MLNLLNQIAERSRDHKEPTQDGWNFGAGMGNSEFDVLERARVRDVYHVKLLLLLLYYFNLFLAPCSLIHNWTHLINFLFIIVWLNY